MDYEHEPCDKAMRLQLQGLDLWASGSYSLEQNFPGVWRAFCESLKVHEWLRLSLGRVKETSDRHLWCLECDETGLYYHTQSLREGKVLGRKIWGIITENIHGDF